MNPDVTEVPRIEATNPIREASQACKAIPTYPPEIREKCYQLFKQDKTQREIEAETGIPRVTIQRWKTHDKWDGRLKLETKAKKRETQTPGSDLTFEEKQERFREGMATQALRLPEIMDGMDDDDLIRNADKLKSLHATSVKSLNLEDAKPNTVINVSLLSRPVVPLQLEAPEEVLALPESVEATIVEESRLAESDVEDHGETNDDQQPAHDQ